MNAPRRTLRCRLPLLPAIAAAACLTALAAGEVSDPLGVAVEAQRNYDAGMAQVATDPALAHELFAKSAALYQTLADERIVNGDLSYNLGNAWIQAGDPGKAIAALLDAQLLLPGDERVAASLAHARSMASPGAPVDAHLTPLDSAAAQWAFLATGTRGWIAAVLWAALWGTVGAGVWLRWGARIPWRGSITTLAVACTLVTATWAIDHARTVFQPRGVITAESSVARKGNGDGFAPAFADPLRRGMEFTLIESRPQWMHVRLRDGHAAWVRSADAHVAGSWATTLPPAGS